MAKKKRLMRLLEMILLGQSRPDWRPKELAKHFGVSETRIYQDIREVVPSGVPMYFSGEGYKITGDFVLGSASLSTDEVLELLYPGHLFDNDGLPQTSQTLLEAKLASCLPVALRRGYGGGFGKSQIKVQSGTVKGPQFRRLHDAVAQRRRIKMRYSSRASGRATEREVDPYALIFRRHSWYLIAKCHTRREVRKFRASRIFSLMFTPLHFAEPKKFSLEEYTKGWWEVYGGEPTNVAVRFRRRVADLIRDHGPRPAQTIQELPGGDIIYRVNVRGSQEISWWIMQYGADAEVLEPKELRDLIRSNAEKMLRLYSRAVRSGRRRVPKVAEEPEPYSSGGD